MSARGMDMLAYYGMVFDNLMSKQKIAQLEKANEQLRNASERAIFLQTTMSAHRFNIVFNFPPSYNSDGK